jgi:hypothetical protein
LVFPSPLPIRRRRTQILAQFSALCPHRKEQHKRRGSLKKRTTTTVPEKKYIPNKEEDIWTVRPLFPAPKQSRIIIINRAAHYITYHSHSQHFHNLIQSEGSSIPSST